MWSRRVAVVLLVAVAFFGWGIATGLYKIFPWYQLSGLIHPLKKSFGIAQQTGGPVYAGLLNLDLKLVTGNSPIQGNAGGMAITSKGILIARAADGSIYRFDPKLGSLSQLALRLPPTNRNLLPEKTATGRPVNAGFLRYNDVMVKSWGGVDHLIISYSYFDPEKQCFTSRLDETPLPADWDTAPIQPNWRRLMETTPCFGFAEERNAFGGNQAGGHLLDAGGAGILWTVGDYEIDGTDSKGPAYPQMTDASYGKVWSISLPDGKAEIFSVGHRDQEGITRDPSGRIWAVEHGPMGGDELNLLHKGGNYGWPYVTLGVQYASRKSDIRSWPLNKLQGRHEGYEAPFFAWLPSIAPSSVEIIEGIDPRWDGDLLVSTLADKSLHRLRLDGDRVLYDERIDMGQRVREIKIAAGRIYILFDNGNFGYLTPRPVAAPGNAGSALEADLNSNGCVTCHSNPKLPALEGIGGTPVASQQGVEYSNALKAAGGIWTEDRLRAWLTSPQQFAPGASMPSPGLDPDSVKKLAAELVEKGSSPSVAGD